MPNVHTPHHMNCIILHLSLCDAIRPLQVTANSVTTHKIVTMAPILDPAIIGALYLDVALTSIESWGRSGFSSTFKITTKVDGEERYYFVKTGSGKGAEAMFAGKSFRL